MFISKLNLTSTRGYEKKIKNKKNFFKKKNSNLMLFRRKVRIKNFLKNLYTICITISKSHYKLKRKLT